MANASWQLPPADWQRSAKHTTAEQRLDLGSGAAEATAAKGSRWRRRHGCLFANLDCDPGPDLMRERARVHCQCDEQ